MTVCTLVLSLGVAQPAGAIGPDSFGYTANSVAFNFEDISATGSKFLPENDDDVQRLTLPFAFSLYGTSYNDVFTSPNGVLWFGSGEFNPLTNASLSGEVLPNLPMAAVLWDDWVTWSSDDDAMYQETRGTAPARRFIVQWHLVQHCCFFPPASTGTVTFQAVLYEGSNNIEYRYLDTDSGDGFAFGASATVGIRDTNGHTNGRNLQWSHNQAVIADNSAILFEQQVGADLAIDKQCPQSNPGVFVCTLTVTNLSAVPASDVVVTDDLPPGLTAGPVAKSDPSFTCSDPAGAVDIRCTAQTLAGGATATFTYTSQSARARRPARRSATMLPSPRARWTSWTRTTPQAPLSTCRHARRPGRSSPAPRATTFCAARRDGTTSPDWAGTT